jgi:hypothetical protein
MARACDFDHVAMSSLGVPPFKVGVDGSVFFRYDHPTWFASPRSRGYDCFEIASCVEYLRSRHEVGLLNRKIRCKLLMKLRGIKIRETIRRLLYRTRLAEVTREALAIVGFVLSGVWHVRCNVH